MVMTPLGWEMRRTKLLLELKLLEMKAKVFGRLTEEEEKRRKEIYRELNIVF